MMPLSPIALLTLRCLVWLPLSVPLPAIATAGEESGTQERVCFATSRVRAWHAVDRRTLRIEVTGGKTFRMTVGGLCPDLRWARVVAFRSTTGRLCGYGGEQIRVDRQRCWVESVDRWPEPTPPDPAP